MAQTRKEHIVPRMLLSQFAAADGKLWVYEKGKDPRPSRPENECAQRDFYEFEVRRGKTHNQYENWLSRVETKAKPVLEGMRQHRQIDRREKAFWAVFVAALFVRTKKVREQIANPLVQEFGRRIADPEFIRALQLTTLQKQGRLDPSEDIRREAVQIFNTMDANPSFYHTYSLPKIVRVIAKALFSTRCWYMAAAPPNTSFLISDSPVVTWKVRDGEVLTGAGFGGKNTVVMLPVSSRYIWVASHGYLNLEFIATASGMSDINRMIVNFAYHNVYADVKSEEISTLVGAEIDSVAFGKNAFISPTQ